MAEQSSKKYRKKLQNEKPRFLEMQKCSTGGCPGGRINTGLAGSVPRYCSKILENVAKNAIQIADILQILQIGNSLVTVLHII